MARISFRLGEEVDRWDLGIVWERYDPAPQPWGPVEVPDWVPILARLGKRSRLFHETARAAARRIYLGDAALAAAVLAVCAVEGTPALRRRALRTLLKSVGC